MNQEKEKKKNFVRLIPLILSKCFGIEFYVFCSANSIPFGQISFARRCDLDNNFLIFRPNKFVLMDSFHLFFCQSNIMEFNFVTKFNFTNEKISQLFFFSISVRNVCFWNKYFIGSPPPWYDAKLRSCGYLLLFLLLRSMRKLT